MSRTAKKSTRGAKTEATSKPRQQARTDDNELVMSIDDISQLALQAGEVLSILVNQSNDAFLDEKLGPLNKATALLKYKPTYVAPKVTALEVGKRCLNLDMKQKESTQNKMTTASTMVKQSRTDTAKDYITDVINNVDLVGELISEKRDNLKQIAAKKKIKHAPDTAGKAWFDLPASRLTKSVKQDYEIIKHKSIFYDKGHFGKIERGGPPKYFQVGTVIGGAADWNNRINRKDRQQTITDQLIHDTKRGIESTHSNLRAQKRGPHVNWDGMIAPGAKRKKGNDNNNKHGKGKPKSKGIPR